MLSIDVYKIPWEIFLQVGEVISSTEKTVHVNMQFEELLLKKDWVNSFSKFIPKPEHKYLVIT